MPQNLKKKKKKKKKKEQQKKKKIQLTEYIVFILSLSQTMINKTTALVNLNKGTNLFNLPYERICFYISTAFSSNYCYLRPNILEIEIMRADYN